MPVTMPDLVADLLAESRVLHDLLSTLDGKAWDRPTPAEGWAIRDQVSHLAYFDEAARAAATEPDRFRRAAAGLMALGPGFPDEVAARYRDLPGDELLGWFRSARRALADTFAQLDPRTRVPWYGPDMSAASAVTARIMETWAHGQDVADALGVTREPTARLRHIAHLGVGTFAFVFGLHGRAVPGVPVRVDLAAPDGAAWAWGPPDARARVSGPALDFCLTVTQRRHVDDTALHVEGPVATEWMSIAQAFAGPPGPGRKPAGEAR